MDSVLRVLGESLGRSPGLGNQYVLDSIHLRGVAVHNLRDVDVDIPLGKLVVICGVSGSGKTSLALDTLYALSKSTDRKIAEENRMRLEAVAASKTSDPKVVEYATTLLGDLKR